MDSNENKNIKSGETDDAKVTEAKPAESAKATEATVVLNEKELIKKVEEAAKKGAKAGAKHGGSGFKTVMSLALVKVLVPLIVGIIAVIVGMSILVPAVSPFTHLFDKEGNVAGHDLTLENHGILGYTVADFSEAVLGKSEQLAKLEVYEREVTDVATVKEVGLIKINAFSKSQIITYTGVATYTVDLSKIKKKHVKMDEENKIITMYIPHAELKQINVPEDKIEYGEVQKGALSFGKIKLTPEEVDKVRGEAISKMEQKLKDENEAERADKYARLSVLDIYQPIIKSVDRSFVLNVEFQEDEE